MTGPKRPWGLRPANSSMWRLTVLIVIHFVIVVHVTHWLVNGKTLAGIGPSEAMDFAKYDIVNVGLICFSAAVLTAAVFGRFFCGWGCHLLALQDLCRWLLLKVGIRPRPLRSRLLRFVPWIAFFYMFLWPVFFRVWIGDDFAGPSTAWTTTDLWGGLPGLTISVITLAVCGFLIVYVLGSKGFCTYACPYGAIIGAADKFAPFRVRVTDACRGCARCTAGCTSNVRVHEEVRDYGMVVDRGCMRCMDCVGTCPNNALYYGPGRPPIFKIERPGAQGYRKRWNTTWTEDALLAGVFAAAFVTFRGLYGAVPFLLTLGISGSLSFLCLALVRLVTKTSVSFGGWRMSRGGELTRAGRVFAGVMGVVLVFFAHSAVIRWNDFTGDRLYRLTAVHRAAALDPDRPLEALTGGDRALAEKAMARIERADTWGFFANPESPLKLAWMHLLTGNRDSYQEHMAVAVEEQPFSVELHLLRGREFIDRGLFREATMAYVAAVEASPSEVSGYHALGALLARLGDYERAIEVFDRGIAAVPQAAVLYYDGGVALALWGDAAGAAARFEQVLALEPEHRQARENLAGALISLGRPEEAVEHLKIAARLAPEDATIRLQTAEACLMVGDLDAAEAEARAALDLDPEIRGADEVLALVGARR